ncbi:MAG TPA: hypothetical protein VFP98_10330, partial [Candidatus Polarisedimenticolia bacterium]|nr:hypothetical protein [Candidatus Polarisedimenticolia bacterium]
TSGADAASAGLDRAMRLNPLNPLYPATRADRSWDRSVPLTPGVLASTHLDLQRAHRLDPGNPDHLFRLAQLHARAWFEIRADEATAARAERLYRRGLALGRMDPRPRLELAAFLVARGRREDGLIEIREALRIEPKFLMARLALCRALLEGGDRPAAAAELARLQAVVSELAGYAPANGYERDLMLFEPAALADLDSRLR